MATTITMAPMGDGERDEDRTLFLSNLNQDVSEEILYELFLQAGPIEKCSIVDRSKTVRVGTVVYKHGSSVKYAEDIFEGTSLFNQELEISTTDPSPLPQDFGISVLRGERPYMDNAYRDPYLPDRESYQREQYHPDREDYRDHYYPDRDNYHRDQYLPDRDNYHRDQHHPDKGHYPPDRNQYSPDKDGHGQRNHRVDRQREHRDRHHRPEPYNTTHRRHDNEHRNYRDRNRNHHQRSQRYH